MTTRTKSEQRAYKLGQQNRRKGLALRDSDFVVALRFGIVDALLDASTDGWYDEDALRERRAEEGDRDAG